MNDIVRYLEDEVLPVRRELALSTALCRLDRQRCGTGSGTVGTVTF
jgi:hypothetical protein